MRRVSTVLVILIAGFAWANAARPGGDRSSLDGLRVVYQFASGRTYEAVYARETVHFTLLYPKQANPPSQVLPFTARPLRKGLFLVAWTAPEFHTTFVIDLERREVYASALRDGQTSFFEPAKILEVQGPTH